MGNADKGGGRRKRENKKKTEFRCDWPQTLKMHDRMCSIHKHSPRADPPATRAIKRRPRTRCACCRPSCLPNGISCFARSAGPTRLCTSKPGTLLDSATKKGKQRRRKAVPCASRLILLQDESAILLETRPRVVACAGKGVRPFPRLFLLHLRQGKRWPGEIAALPSRDFRHS